MRLTEFIRTDAERILREWEEFVKTLRPGAALPRWLLRAYAAAMLQSIADDVEEPIHALELAAPGEGSAPPIDHAAAVHVDLRIESGFDLAQIIAEYRALRASILRRWRIADSDGFAHGAQEISRLTDAIDQAIAQTVSVYEEREARYRDRFLGMLGHDLRNPLNAILLGAVSLGESPELAQEQHATVARILGSVHRLDRMVSDILDFARGRLGSPMPIVLTPINLGTALREIADEVQSANPGFEIDLRMDGDLTGAWDPERLKQAVSNLLLNAIQHGKEKTIGLWARSEGGFVVLEVSNDGRPIPKEMLGSIFDPLVHGRNSEPSRTGLGLGLFIVNEIVTAHRGTIIVTSSQETGTTFSVRLPRHGV